MPEIVGGSQRVVDDGHGLTIDEYAGNVSTSEDRISIAHVRATRFVTAHSTSDWSLHITRVENCMQHLTHCGGR